MNNQANNKRIAVNTLLLTIRMLFVMAIGLYTTRVVLNVLGASDYGIFNVVAGFVAMFAFINTSMSNGIQRFYNFELGKNGGKPINIIFNTAIRIQIAVALVIFILTETVGVWYIYEKMVIPEERFWAGFWCFQFSVVSLILSIFKLPFLALVMAHERMNFFAIMSIFDATLKLIIAISLPYVGGDKLIVYGALYMTITFIDTIFYILYSKIKFPADMERGRGDKDMYKRMLSFTGWNIFGSFGGVMRDQGLNMILNLFYGTVANAARGVAHQVMAACKSFVGNVTTASRPQLTQSYADGNLQRSVSIMHSMSKMCYISLFIFALPITLEVKFVLHIWLGDGVPNYTEIFLIWVMAEALIDVFNPPVSFMVHATGKMRKYQIIGTVVSLLSLPVAYFGLKNGWEPFSVFVVAFIFSIFRQIVSVLVLRTLMTFSVSKYLRDVVIPMLVVTLVSCVIPCILHFVMDIGWCRLIVVGIVSIICVGITSLFIGLNKTERGVIISMISSKFK